MFESQHIRPVENWIIKAISLLIRSYQILVSPLLGPACRFSPTCSQYAMEALKRHGLFKGLLLALKRLLRCHPWNDGGFDPVP